MRKEKEDQLAVAMLAALTAGEMNNVDQSTIQKSSQGSARNIDPRNFISSPNPHNVPNGQQGTRVLQNDPSIIQQPVSRPAGSEYYGDVNVNVQDLLIPEGLQEEMNNIPMPPGHDPIPIPPMPTMPPPTEHRGEFVTPPTYSTPAKKDEVQKAIGYIKRKIRVIEKNQELILEALKIMVKNTDDR